MGAPFDKVHTTYDMFMNFWYLYKEDAIVELLDLAGHEVIVDIGGGTGHVAHHVSNYCDKIFVLDESERMLSHVSKMENIQPIHGDALATEFEDDTIDGVIITDVMHHIQDQEKLIQEMHRILKTNGKIIILDFNKAHLWTKLLSVMESVLFGKLYYKNLDYFTGILKRHSFIIEKTINKGFYFIILGKKL